MPMGKDYRLVFGQVNSVIYTNYKGETSLRTMIPLSMWYGTTTFHTTPGWIVECYDLDKSGYRSYFLEDIKEVAPAGGLLT